MTEREVDMAAAEYVLGTLPREEREAFARRLATDAAARVAVAEWEARLSPLARLVDPVQPPPELWNSLRSSLGLTPTLSGSAPARMPPAPVDTGRLRRRLAAWRTATIGMAALAAGLAALLVLDPVWLADDRDVDERYVAVVDVGDTQPALIVTVDMSSAQITVRPVGAEAPQGHSLELWHIAGDEPPRSLGVIDISSEIDRLEAPLDAAAGTIAVTLEPEGGSPTGQPTGDILYKGQLLRVE